MSKKDSIKLSKYLESQLPHYYPNKGDLIEIIQTIADATIPIRGLLEKGITSREITYRMDLSDPEKDFLRPTANLAMDIFLRGVQSGNSK